MKPFLLEGDLPGTIPIEDSSAGLMKKMDLARFVIEREQQLSPNVNLLNEPHILISDRDELSLFD